jgi:hypothetical protein
MAKKPLNVVMFYDNNTKDDGAFDRAALTYGREHGGTNPDIYIPFDKSSDYLKRWNQLASSGRTISGLAQFSHGGLSREGNNGEIYFSDGTLSGDAIAQLGKLNYAPGAKIDLHVCQSGDGNKSLAQEFADAQGVPAIGRNGHAIFSTYENRFTFSPKDYFRSRPHDIGADWNGHLYLESYYRGENVSDPEVKREIGFVPPHIRGQIVPTTTFNPSE